MPIRIVGVAKRILSGYWRSRRRSRRRRTRKMRRMRRRRRKKRYLWIIPFWARSKIERIPSGGLWMTVSSVKKRRDSIET